MIVNFIKILFLEIRVIFLLLFTPRELWEAARAHPSGDFPSFWGDNALPLPAQLCVSSLLHQGHGLESIFWGIIIKILHIWYQFLSLECLSSTLYIIVLFSGHTDMLAVQSCCYPKTLGNHTQMLPLVRNHFWILFSFLTQRLFPSRYCNVITLHLYHTYHTLF